MRGYVKISNRNLFDFSFDHLYLDITIIEGKEKCKMTALVTEYRELDILFIDEYTSEAFYKKVCENSDKILEMIGKDEKTFKIGD